MIHGRHRPWQVAVVIMSTTCALLTCRPGSTDQLATTSVKSTGKRPNIVVMMADDMGYSDLGCFGGEIRTPNLDRLAGDGLRFTNFYSENMCWVSRADLLTGIYHRTSMVDSELHPRCVTLPEVLKQQGYQTRMSGKWHLAGKKCSTYPMDRGFQDFYGILGGASSFFAPYSLSRDRWNVEHEAHDNPGYYFTNAISDEAVRMANETKRDDSMFLYVAYTAAHWPLHAPEKTRDGRKVRPGNLPEIMPGPEDTYQSYGHGWANLSNTPYRLFKQYDHEYNYKAAETHRIITDIEAGILTRYPIGQAPPNEAPTHIVPGETSQALPKTKTQCQNDST